MRTLAAILCAFVMAGASAQQPQGGQPQGAHPGTTHGGAASGADGGFPSDPYYVASPDQMIRQGIDRLIGFLMGSANPDPASVRSFVDVEGVPARDWGSDTIPLPEFGFQPDVGVFLGAAVSHTRYAFRRHPFSSKHSLGFGWAFEANEPRVRYQGRFRRENSDIETRLALSYSGIEVLNFYGFGNNSLTNVMTK